MKTIILMVVFLLFLSACGGVKIEQEVYVDSIIDCSYHVNTMVWVRKWSGEAVSLEYSKRVDATEATLDSVKTEEYEKAEKFSAKVIEAYRKSNCKEK